MAGVAPIRMVCWAAAGVAQAREMTTSSERAAITLPPLVDRRRFLIVAAHDAPVAIGLASDNHDVDILAAEDGDQLVGGGLELRRPRLLAERRARIDVVLDELRVPVLARGHGGCLVEPVDERVLLGEAGAVDELLGGDGIEEEGGRRVRVHAPEHAPHVLAPVLFAEPEGEGRGAAAREHADRAVRGLETVRDVERLPGTALLVL